MTKVLQIPREKDVREDYLGGVVGRGGGLESYYHYHHHDHDHHHYHHCFCYDYYY